VFAEDPFAYLIWCEDWWWQGLATADGETKFGSSWTPLQHKLLLSVALLCIGYEVPSKRDVLAPLLDYTIDEVHRYLLQVVAKDFPVEAKNASMEMAKDTKRSLFNLTTEIRLIVQ
jgi:hypothetical protein